jgi:hypothetical protein
VRPCGRSRSGWASADPKATEIYAHYVPDATDGAAFGERAFGFEGDATDSCSI